MKSTKFLGIFIDENLSWNDHISSLCTKVSMNVGVMSRLKWFLPKHILVTLYNSFVLPYLNYDSVAWGSSTSGCNKLFLLQKK